MAKKRHKKDLKRGPFTTADVEKALKLAGWKRRTGGGGHGVMYEHPTLGKIPVSNWTGLRAWDPILKGLCETMQLSREELLRLLNGEKP